MKISLFGVETNNKGAELMLYAILQEIERKFPDAIVYLPYHQCKQGLGYVNTKLDFRYSPFNKFFDKFHVGSILRRLYLPLSIYTRTFVSQDSDWFIDGSGFAFGDQWELKKEQIQMWDDILRPLHKKGCKIVFLPQAFGPVEKNSTKSILSLLNKYADVLMPREQMSYDYLQESGVIDMQKVRKYTDFTSLVEGVFPESYEHLVGGVCIIPNRQMIRKGKISYDEYIRLLSAFIMEGKKNGLPVYLLNHEGQKDAELCLKCRETIGNDIEVVTGLNALEVKGLISSAYIVITSRFHGLASALNSRVPVLSTSWSHKYEELYLDYKLNGYILPLNDIDAAIVRVRGLLDKDENLRIRQHLSHEVPKIKSETQRMWEYIWKI